jgi:SAM-dependent methyltransferase
MPSFAEILNDAISSGRLLKAVLSRPRRSVERPARGMRAGRRIHPGPARKVVVRPVRVKGEPAYQFAIRADNRETHENVPPAAAADRILGWCESTFSDCHLFTPEAEFSVRVARDGKAHVKRKVTSPQPAANIEHDRAKPYLIPDGFPCPFLIETGVMTATGKVRAAKYHKFRQINRFLELVNDIVPELPEAGRLNVVDFGSGKSFLTFAVHHLLTVVHRRDVAIVGLDRNADVVAQCVRLAEKLDLRGLSFRRQDISEFEGFPDADRIDLVVSLHACDTATDDALAQAVRWNAGVIFAVPCCQHEIAAALDVRDVRSDRLQPVKGLAEAGHYEPAGDPLRAVTRHGILKERLAAIATDALRAEILEECGYRTQVVEFIDLEHTAKNVLIRAVRRPGGDPGRMRRRRDIQDGAAGSDRAQEIQQLKQLLGISRFHLEDALEDRCD